MKPYGMNKLQADDLDVAGCRENGRATRAYSLNQHSYHSLRKGKKARIRRIIKRQARQEGKRQTNGEE
jgi:hypothetical protein